MEAKGLEGAVEFFLGTEDSDNELPSTFPHQEPTEQSPTSIGLTLYDEQGWYEPDGPHSDVLPALDGLPLNVTLGRMLERHSQKVFRAASQTMLYINRDTLWANRLSHFTRQPYMTLKNSRSAYTSCLKMCLEWMWGW